ncbi:hypothetical protein PRZ48_009770 [Zasmidium cellare]|uniref:Something about silencing protein 4 domain-containing protein n=1 Tax=Zasmidium cellare TaxID=395010 RepID=A0ABR0ECQ4_ZASCE|nr:hypothetical protein PRZ48_009770 [Zasmidium cellare]
MKLIDDDGISLAHTTTRAVNGSLATADDNGPPTKKRRLATHGKQQRNTLDAYGFAKSTTPLPPNRIIQQPHGPLLETINGVVTTLDANEDELLHPSPKHEPQRKSRSPHPAPPPQQKQEDKRTLRSQDDGPRVKSELATYFPNFEDVIFDVEQEEEFLTVDTALYITDDTKPGKPEISPAKSSKSAANGRRTSSVNGIAPSPFSPQRSSSAQFNGSPILDLDFMAKTLPEKPEDPLTDEYFLKSHRRAERKEKQLRNIEKERAMHEKVQLDRLLDGLQGHDWLRVLGITGVTDTEAKKFEAKRDYFIAEVQALVDKFRQWREQEKKQRLVKEAAAAAREAEEEGDTTEGSVEPPSSDLNASAARQLQQETVNALKTSARPSGKGKGPAHPTSHPATPTTVPTKFMLPPQPPSPEMPITSFYSKPHLRDAALGKARHGRNVLAFGQPVPELEEVEFVLPDDYLTEEALRANARERRRRKRESAANVSNKKAS